MRTTRTLGISAVLLLLIASAPAGAQVVRVRRSIDALRAAQLDALRAGELVIDLPRDT